MLKRIWISLGLTLLFLGGIAALALSQQMLPDVLKGSGESEQNTLQEPAEEESEPLKELTDEERLLLQAEGVGLGEVIKAEDESKGPGMRIELKYNQYNTTDIYFVVENKVLNIKEAPGDHGPAVTKLFKNDKLNYVETITLKALSTDGTGYIVESALNENDVEGENQDLEVEEERSLERWIPQRWYHVTWESGGKERFGFIKEGEITKRIFQYEKMEEAIKNLEAHVITGRVTHIYNYRNRMGMAPLWNGKTRDGRGMGRSQSAPGYFEPGDAGDFIYLEDGTIVQMQGVVDDQIKVKVLQSEEILYVPAKYIPEYQTLDQLTRVVVVDRGYQNEGVYEKIEGKWTLISKSLATTGTTGPYSFPTPLGYYYVMEKRSQFLYLKDGTNEVEGYAPYTIRFCGGAYIHGVPVAYIYRDGERITPGIREYSKTIGTIPLSHKCVRNYTSHAKFLYDWYVPRETAVIVIE
ncbi:MAG: L,D-transpeptidase [Anaerovoracaceae bacterium]|jgi:hypothetical protein